MLALCSDGIIEAGNSDEVFGLKRTRQCIKEASSQGVLAEQIAIQIFREVDSYTKRQEQDDDQTVVVLKVK